MECQETSFQIWKGLRLQLRQREGKSFRATGGLPGAGKPCLKVAGGPHSGEDVLEVCGVAPKAPLEGDCPTVLSRTVGEKIL